MYGLDVVVNPVFIIFGIRALQRELNCAYVLRIQRERGKRAYLYVSEEHLCITQIV
jgi:hypothetical protein